MFVHGCYQVRRVHFCVEHSNAILLQQRDFLSAMEFRSEMSAICGSVWCAGIMCISLNFMNVSLATWELNIDVVSVD